MWTVEKLREVAERRGHLEMTPELVGKALLAHERMQERTEEVYPPEGAKAELDALLDRLDVNALPSARPRDPVGLAELRTRLLERQRPLGAPSPVNSIEPVAPKEKRMDRER